MNYQKVLTSKTWLLILFCFATLAAIVVPSHLVLTFQNQYLDLLIEWGVSLVFAIDFLLRLPGFLQDIQKDNNSKRWLVFAIDLIASLPLRLLFGYAILDLPRILKLFRVVSLLQAKQNSHLWISSLLQLTGLSYWILLSIHWLSCGWIALHPEPESYLRALYWTVTTLTTVGYGDVTPTTPNQTIYTMLMMFLGVGFYGYIIGNVTNLLTKTDLLEDQHKSKMESLNGFLRHRQVPDSLQQRINDYYDHLWENKMGFDEAQLTADLPPSLQHELSLVLKQKLIAKVPFFQQAQDSLLRDLARHLQAVVYTPGDIIFQQGDQGHCMYFIGQGRIALMDPHKGTPHLSLEDGDFFGEVSLLKGGLRIMTAKAQSYCDLYVLAQEPFERSLHLYEDFARHIQEISGKRAAALQQNITVHYAGMNRDVQVTDSTKSILEVSVQNMIPHFQDCGGKGLCTTCRVKVHEGASNLSPPTDKERALCASRGWDKHTRLACQTQAYGPVILSRAVKDNAQVTRLQFENKNVKQGEFHNLAILVCDYQFTSSAPEATQVVSYHNHLMDLLGDVILMNAGLVHTDSSGMCMGLFGLNSQDQAAALQAAIRAASAISHQLQGKRSAHFSGLSISFSIQLDKVILGYMGHKDQRKISLLSKSVANRTPSPSPTEQGRIFVAPAAQAIIAASTWKDQLTISEEHTITSIQTTDPLYELQKTIGIELLDEDLFASRLRHAKSDTVLPAQLEEPISAAAALLLKRLLFGMAAPNKLAKLGHSLARQYALYDIKESHAENIRLRILNILQAEYGPAIGTPNVLTCLDIHKALLQGQQLNKQSLYDWLRSPYRPPAA